MIKLKFLPYCDVMNDVIYYTVSLINSYSVQYFARYYYSSHGACVVELVRNLVAHSDAREGK